MRRAGAAGFTVMELLMAALVLAVATAPVLLLFGSGAQRTAFGESHLRAHLAAEALLAKAIDRAVRTGFRDLPSGDEVRDSGDGKTRGTVAFEAVGGYPGLWRVTARVALDSPRERGENLGVCTIEKLVHRPEQGLVGDWALATLGSGEP